MPDKSDKNYKALRLALLNSQYILVRIYEYLHIQK
jgi:hypothetical protein